MNGLKVLIIDDEVVFSENMAKLLNTRGYQAKTANGGEEGIQALKKETYDVVVLDLKMPGMNGIETLKKIKEINVHLQVILLTGHGCVETAMEAISLGAFDYLPKPCEVKELSEMIENSQKNKDLKLKKRKRE